MSEPTDLHQVLCPVCRQAVRDADYFTHAKKHQTAETKEAK